MSACDVGLKVLNSVPDNLFSILQAELSNWDYKNAPYNFDKVFGYHKLKAYHVGKIDNTITFPEEIIPIIDWVVSVAGKGHKVVRCFLNLIEPNTNFHLHVDTLRVHKLARRFHIPLTNSKDCFYYTYRKNTVDTWKETKHTMEPGLLYELDNINPHNVKNHGDYRINFIADVIKEDLIDDNLTAIEPEQYAFLNEIFNSGIAISH